MEELNFDTESSYINYLEGLIGKPISEIIKKQNNEYTFKIDNYWYNLYFGLVVGTTFRNGECLELKGDRDYNSLRKLYIKQFAENHQLRDRINNLFERLDTTYTQFKLVDNQKLKELTKNLSEFISHFDTIEKFSTNFFIVSNKEWKYSIKKIEKYEWGLHQQHTVLSKIERENAKVLNTIRGEFYTNAILNFLNYVYYASKLENYEEIKNKIINTIG